MVNYNADPQGKTTWTIKAMPAQARRDVTAYAMRHGMSVAETMAEAVRLLIEREHGTSIIPEAGIPDGKPAADQSLPAVGLASIPGLNMAVELVSLAGQTGITKENRNRANRLAGIILQDALAAAVPQRRSQPNRELGRQPRIVAAKQVASDSLDIIAAEHGEQGDEAVSDTADRL
jgi:hypothetical protein